MDANSNSSSAPQWLSDALVDMRSKYPNARLEPIWRPEDEDNSLPGWRIKCLDCPSKLFFPGPGESLELFEAHLLNEAHAERIAERT